MFNDRARSFGALPRVLSWSSFVLLFSGVPACGGDDAQTTPRSNSGAASSGSTGAAGGTSSTSGGAGATGSTGNSGGAPGTGGSAGTSGTGGSPGAPDAGKSGSAPQIATVAIYQAVQINLMKDGQPVAKLNGPIVKGRPALVRVFVQPGAAWTPHEVSAQLELSAGSKSQTVNVKGASTDGDLATTFNFELSADEMNVDSVTYAISVHDPAAAADTRWPTAGTSTLTPKSSGASIKIVYVPFNYQVGGTAILADASPAAIKKLDDALFAEYPTAKIESSVHAPLDYTGPAIQAMGGGWQQALLAVITQRQRDRPATNVYYYGLVAPSPTLAEYCPAGCVGGVATVPMSPTSSTQFASMGVSYQDGVPAKNLDNMEFRVALQEVAHNFGRLHAFCTVPEGGTAPMGLDPNYPYPTGSIGVWGYDLIGKKLVDPAKNTDIQSYCNPVWISDYTYSAIFDWISKVNAAAPITLESGSEPDDPSQMNLRYFRFE